MNQRPLFPFADSAVALAHAPLGKRRAHASEQHEGANKARPLL